MARLRWRHITQTIGSNDLLTGYKCNTGILRKNDYKYLTITHEELDYPSPEQLGKEALCALCKNQLECLTGSLEKGFEAI